MQSAKFLVVAVLVSILSACGGGNSNSDSSPATGATGSSGSSTAQSGRTTGSNATTISACQDITQPGSYTVTSDLTAPATFSNGVGCINILNVSNVSVDCAGHTITAPMPVTITNAHQFSVAHCALNAVANDIGEATGVEFINSDTGTFDSNSFVTTPGSIAFINVDQTSHLTFSNNSIAGVFEQGGSSYNIVTNNQFSTTTGTSPVAAIEILWGTNNQIIGNTINGSWDSQYANNAPSQVGASDGIMLDYESGDTIANNYIFYVGDNGVEVWGMLAYSTISGNTFGHIGGPAVGGYSFMNMLGNTISNNTATETGNLFSFYRLYGLQAAPIPTMQQLGTGSSVQFSNNVFSNNTWSNPFYMPTPFTGQAAYLPVYNYLNYQFGNPSPGLSSSYNVTDILPSQFSISNNTFTNNSFGHSVPGPDFGGMTVEAGMIVDGGGNVCLTPTNVTSYPLVCN